MTKQFTIPTSLADVKLNSLIEFSKLENLNESELNLKALELICSIPKEDARILPLDEFERLIHRINDILTNIPPERTTFEIDGIAYGRIPNLENISLGEYIDLDTFITPLYEGEIKHDEAFKFLAVLFRPIKEYVNELYSIEEYNDEYIERQSWELMRDKAPADIYTSAVSFFLNLNLELQKITQAYLVEAAQTQTQHEDNSKKIGDGMDLCITWQREMYETLMRSPRLMLSLPLLSCHTNQMPQNLEN